MSYMVEPIGAVFADKDIQRLAQHLSRREKEGYRLHSVFQVSQPGCLGIGTPKVTYLAIYERVASS